MPCASGGTGFDYWPLYCALPDLFQAWGSPDHLIPPDLLVGIWDAPSCRFPSSAPDSNPKTIKKLSEYCLKEVTRNASLLMVGPTGCSETPVANYPSDQWRAHWGGRTRAPKVREAVLRVCSAAMAGWGVREIFLSPCCKLVGKKMLYWISGILGGNIFFWSKRIRRLGLFLV